ncbi:hypothetical protein F5148DRAFT_1286396 [Russula earlei]|uniref:Uncharacterized protein n=1 Tax=Russula earlei TaxID=71964 RepID=A0ACC0U452_9AGAM|nr:hypothetical protein F5148DRAFT_1286396 [Russula earlei]
MRLHSRSLLFFSILLVTLSLFSRYRPSPRPGVLSSPLDPTLRLVDALLDEALLVSLSIRQNHQRGSRPPLRGTEIAAVSRRPSSRSTGSAVDSDPLSVQLCRILRGKTLFLVGPHDTLYQLHSFLLGVLRHAPSPGPDPGPAVAVPTAPVSCPGPSSCPFHALCRPPASSTSGPESLAYAPDDAAAPNNGSLMRFLLSGTLKNPSPAQGDHARLLASVPLVDPRTGVRVVESRWVRQAARKADVLVLNRGPLPAPAWSYAYAYNASARNLTWLAALRLLERERPPAGPLSDLFADVLARLDDDDDDDDDPDRFPSESDAQKLIRAALHSTLSAFLPSLLSTLGGLRERAGRRAILGKRPCFLVSDPARLLARLLAQAEAMDNPWSAYYNAQVYMHDRLLARLLPTYDVLYLSSLSTGTAVPSYAAKDWSCIQRVFETPRGAMMGHNFLRDFIDALGTWKP